MKIRKIAASGLAVIRFLKTYPAISAALTNFGVFAAGYFGLHLTAGELVGAVGVLDVLFGLIVHSNVTPLIRLAETELVAFEATHPVEPVTRGGYPAGSTAVTDLPPPPPGISQ